MVGLAFAVAIVTALALVGVALVFRDNGSDTTSAATAAGVDLAGIPQDGAVLGKPSAHVTLIEYADAQCPGCRYYTLELFPSITKRYIETGKIKTEYRGFPFIGPDSVKALRFILAAGEQDRLWQLQQELYRYQSGENKGWVTDDLIRERASAVLDAAGPAGHVFNLGHGILPETAPDHARFLVDTVRETSARRAS